MLKNWETEVRFSSSVGFGGTVLSLSYDRRERESEGGRDGEGERDTETERGRDGGRGREREGEGEGEGEGGREILTAEENCEGGRGVERDDFLKFYCYFFPNYILWLKFIYLCLLS